MADGLHHPAHLAISSLDHDEFDQAPLGLALDQPSPHRPRDPIIELDAGGEFA
jgi:hypothetical protein